MFEKIVKDFGEYLPPELKVNYVDVIDMYGCAEIVLSKKSWFPKVIATFNSNEGKVFIEVKDKSYTSMLNAAAMRYTRENNRSVIIK